MMPVTITLPNDLAATVRAAVYLMLDQEATAVARLRPGKRRSDHEKRVFRLRAALEALEAAIDDGTLQ